MYNGDVLGFSEQQSWVVCRICIRSFSRSIKTVFSTHITNRCEGLTVLWLHRSEAWEQRRRSQSSEGEKRLIGKHRGQARVPRGEGRGHNLPCDGRGEHMYDLQLHLLYITWQTVRRVACTFSSWVFFVFFFLPVWCCWWQFRSQVTELNCRCWQKERGGSFKHTHTHPEVNWQNNPVILLQPFGCVCT